MAGLVDQQVLERDEVRAGARVRVLMTRDTLRYSISLDDVTLIYDGSELDRGPEDYLASQAVAHREYLRVLESGKVATDVKHADTYRLRTLIGHGNWLLRKYAARHDALPSQSKADLDECVRLSKDLADIYGKTTLALIFAETGALTMLPERHL